MDGTTGGAARSGELAELGALLEERNRLLEQQLGRQASAAKWFALLGIVLALVVGAWVYLLMQQMAGDAHRMAGEIGQMKTYLKNMSSGGAGNVGGNHMASVARNTGSMSADIGAVREAMQQVSGDIASMRLAMESTRAEIGTMNQGIGGMVGDMRSVSTNIAKMSRSVGHMNQSVGRLSRDGQYMRDPMRAMDSVMPWR